MLLGPQRQQPAAGRAEIGRRGLRRESRAEEHETGDERGRPGRRPGEETTHERRADGERPEQGRRLFDPMRRRRDQREAADAVGLVERERERNRAAERMADDQRLSEFQDPDGAGQDRGLFADPAGDGRGIAGARPVEGDHAEIVGQPADERMGEMTELAAEPVDENDRRPLPRSRTCSRAPLTLRNAPCAGVSRSIRHKAATDSAAIATSSVARIASPSKSPRTNSVHPPAPPPPTALQAPRRPARRADLAQSARLNAFGPSLSPRKAFALRRSAAMPIR